MIFTFTYFIFYKKIIRIFEEEKKKNLSSASKIYNNNYVNNSIVNQSIKFKMTIIAFIFGIKNKKYKINNNKNR